MLLSRHMSCVVHCLAVNLGINLLTCCTVYKHAFGHWLAGDWVFIRLCMFLQRGWH